MIVASTMGFRVWVFMTLKAELTKRANSSRPELVAIEIGPRVFGKSVPAPPDKQN